MYAALSHRGEYLQEGRDRARAITAVATSITAFVGRALRGPVDEPVPVASFGDFERRFGPLWPDSALGFAVRDFFDNGGSCALIVRLVHAPDPSSPEAALRSHALLRAGALTLRARHPGAWGNHLRLRIDRDGGTGDPASFNLYLRDAQTGLAEAWRGLTLNPAHPRRVDRVLASESRLVSMQGTLPLVPSSVPTLADTGVATTDLAAPEQALVLADLIGEGRAAARTGLYALARADLFTLLCIPPYLPNGGDMLDGGVDQAVVDAAARLCEQRRAMLLLDPPVAWNSAAAAAEGVAGIGSSPNAAVFFPRLVRPLAHRKGRMGTLVPCGAIAGVFARTDQERGVWKAPAGVDASLVEVAAMSAPLNDAENSSLNRLGINCLRRMPVVGSIVWGARTLHGDASIASDWKFIPVRRTALFIEESLLRGTRWVLGEANREPLWAQLRLNVSAFMHSLFLQGAFQGRTPQEAYFVRCERASMSEDDLQRGVVTIEVGFAPFRRNEFVRFVVRQRCGASD